MVATVLIIAFSLLLLIYWFRYCCILLLSTHVEQPITAARACPAKLTINNVRDCRRIEPALDDLRRSLDRDYALFAYLLKHAAGIGANSLEDRLLLIDYKAMQWWYRLTRTTAPGQARCALDEMATVLGLLAGKMDERAAAQGRA